MKEKQINYLNFFQKLEYNKEELMHEIPTKNKASFINLYTYFKEKENSEKNQIDKMLFYTLDNEIKLVFEEHSK